MSAWKREQELLSRERASVLTLITSDKRARSCEAIDRLAIVKRSQPRTSPRATRAKHLRERPFLVSLSRKHRRNRAREGSRNREGEPEWRGSGSNETCWMIIKRCRHRAPRCADAAAT